MDGTAFPILLMIVAAVSYAASKLPRLQGPTDPPTPTPEDRLQAYRRRLGRVEDDPDLLRREAEGLAYKRWLLAQNDTYRHNRIKAGEPV